MATPTQHRAAKKGLCLWCNKAGFLEEEHVWPKGLRTYLPKGKMHFTRENMHGEVTAE